MEEKTYYDYLFEQSEEEKEISKMLDDEREWFQQQSVYKEHYERVDRLLNELKVAGEKRREEAKKHKPKRRAKAKHMSEKELAAFKAEGQRIKEERINSYPEDLKALIKAYEGLDEGAKKVFKKETYFYAPDYDDYKDPQTTEKDIKELLEILVQETIDFINERGLKDIWSVGFSADSLQESARYGEWTPATDASIYVTGMGKEIGRNGEEYSVLQNIGSYM